MSNNQQLMCKIKGHEECQYVYLCVNQKCQKQDRLLCTKCAILHGDSQYFVLVEDIIKKDGFKIENWPIDFEGQQIKTFLGQNNPETLDNIIEVLFTDLEEKIAESIDRIKQNIKNQFKEQIKNLADKMINLHLQYEKAYSLDYLKSMLCKLIEQQINKEQIEIKIKEFLHSFERENERSEAKRSLDQIIPQCEYYIDQTRFKEITNREILQSLEKLEKSFKGSFNPLNWKFVNSQLYQSDCLIEVKKNISFQSRSEYGEEVIFSDRNFQYGTAYMKIKFDKVSENYKCHVLLGLYNELDGQKVFSPYMCIMCCEQVEGMVCQNGQKFRIEEGSQVEMVVNFDKNALIIRQVLDDWGYGATWIYQQQQKLNITPKKIFVFFSSCGANQISLVSSY